MFILSYFFLKRIIYNDLIYNFNFIDTFIIDIKNNNIEIYTINFINLIIFLNFIFYIDYIIYNYKFINVN